MKLNHILYIGVFAALSATLSSCSFLEVEPQVIDGKGYYTNETKINYGLAGVYGALSSEALYGHYYSLQISNADDLCYYNNYNNSEARVDKYNHNAGTEVVYATWNKLYEGIKNANVFIEELSVTEIDADKLSSPLELYIAEARFLRAYYHFLLAQAWGDVPLYDKATTSPNPTDVQIAATPQEQVLMWCINEMETAMPLLSEDVTITPSRVTQHVAKAIIARVALFAAGESVKEIEGVTKKDLYAKAALHAGDVISSGLFNLNPSYSQVFINMISDQYDIAYHESMWEAEFLGDRSSSQEWSNGRIGDLIGLKSQSSLNNYAEWACNYSYGYYNGSWKLWQLYWSADRTSDEASKSDRITDSRQEWNLPPYNYQGSNARKISYKVDDVQYNEVLTIPASMSKTPWVYNNNFSLPVEEFAEGVDMTVENPFNLENAKYDPTLMGSVRNAGKWRRETIYENQMHAKQLYTTINFPILRFSDVLLMYAEAVNEANGAPDELAKQSLLRVRERAGIKTDEGQLSDYRSFRDLVRNERARELAFEGLRKWDLIRWGIFVEEMHEAGTDFPTENKYRNATITNFAAGTYAGVVDKHIYLPVPTKELAVNHAMKQNPMW